MPKKRFPKPSLLVVCEGEKTEVEYLNQLRIEKRLQKGRLKIVASCDCGGTDPRTLVKAAKKLKAKLEREEQLLYDEVWIVIDRDQHTTFDAAIDEAKGNRFEVAYSVPCFELWYLLHFIPQTAAIERHVVRQKLKEFPGLAGYDKEGLYTVLIDKLSDARQNAAALRAYHERNNNPEISNPVTRVDELVAKIESMTK